MCIAAWVWQAHPVYQLLLFLNRDEFHERPTEPVHWWGEDEKILGGRDELGGGTWLACSKDGRVAFLTNVRLPDELPVAKTRGVLPLRFLESTKKPHEFAEEIAQEAMEYNGFNLVVSDLRSRTMVYLSNRHEGKPSINIQTVSPGFHVLSNAQLDTPWPKAKRLLRSFEELVVKQGNEELILEQVIEALLGDRTKAARDELPKTGVPPEWEFELSSIFIETDSMKGRYGTRSMAAVSVKLDEEAKFYERYLENGEWKEHTVQYQIENAS